MSSSAATMAASKMMKYSKASLQHLIRSHLRPNATATATAADAAFRSTENASQTLLPSSELRQFIRSGGAAQFGFGFAAKNLFVDQSRFEAGDPTNEIDDGENKHGDEEEEEEDSDGYYSDLLVGERITVDSDSGTDSDSDFEDEDDDDDSHQ